MFNKFFRAIFVLMLVIGLVAVQAPTSVHAATLTVTNNNDRGPGSLRQAILDASSGDTIDFDADYTITLSSQLPVIDKELTIVGNGAANTIIEASTCNPVTLPGGCTPATYRVFEVNVSGNLTLDRLTVRHGNFYGGGAISNHASLTLTDSTFSDNSAKGNGGAILNFHGQGFLKVLSDNFGFHRFGHFHRDTLQKRQEKERNCGSCGSCFWNFNQDC